jgi:serine/threonine-protein kinase
MHQNFGIAQPLDAVCILTTTNVTVGTAAYAAPEQLTGQDVDGGPTSAD